MKRQQKRHKKCTKKIDQQRREKYYIDHTLDTITIDPFQTEIKCNIKVPKDLEKLFDKGIISATDNELYTYGNCYYNGFDPKNIVINYNKLHHLSFYKQNEIMEIFFKYFNKIINQEDMCAYDFRYTTNHCLGNISILQCTEYLDVPIDIYTTIASKLNIFDTISLFSTCRQAYHASKNIIHKSIINTNRDELMRALSKMFITDFNMFMVLYSSPFIRTFWRLQKRPVFFESKQPINIIIKRFYSGTLGNMHIWFIENIINKNVNIVIAIMKSIQFTMIFDYQFVVSYLKKAYGINPNTCYKIIEQHANFKRKWDNMIIPYNIFLDLLSTVFKDDYSLFDLDYAKVANEYFNFNWIYGEEGRGFNPYTNVILIKHNGSDLLYYAYEIIKNIKPEYNGSKDDSYEVNYIQHKGFFCYNDKYYQFMFPYLYYIDEHNYMSHDQYLADLINGQYERFEYPDYDIVKIHDASLLRYLGYKTEKSSRLDRFKWCLHYPINESFPDKFYKFRNLLR